MAERERLSDRLRNLFPFGPAPAVLAIAAIAAMGLRHAEIGTRESGDRLVFWSFAEAHLGAYEDLVPAFEETHGVEVELRHVHWRVIDRRLRSAMWAGRGVPDLVEIPQEKVGSFFRGPLDSIGFEDLRPRIEDTGPAGTPIHEDAVEARLTAYEHRGLMLGFPHDVHPTVIAYRWRDFEEAGIDPASLKTWDDFLEAGQRLTRRERTPGSPVDDRRYMLAIDELTPNTFQCLLLQRGGNWFGEDGELLFDSELVLDTLMWYVRMGYGPDRIGDGAAPFPNHAFYQAVQSGYYICFIAPDWMTQNFQDNIPGFGGELRLMPMPAWEPGGRRTSTWGATMLAVTTQGDSEDLAWELAKHLYMNREVAEQTFSQNNIISPFRSAWSSPVFSEPRAYWSGQAIGEVFLDLADEVPSLRSTPFVPMAQQKIVNVISSCADRYRERGEEGFEEFCRAQLADTAAYIRHQMRRDPF